MTDTELEDRVRATLRAVADATPLDAAPSSRSRRGRWLAVAACVALLAGGVALVRAGDDQMSGVRATAPTAPSRSSPLPAGYDLRTAGPVFTADGTADDVARAYLRDRFPDYPSPDVQVEPVQTDGDEGRTRWSTGSELEGTLGSGELHLRQLGRTWTVIAATTDGLDLSDLSYDGARVHGTVRSTSDESFQVHLVDDLLEDSHDGTNPRSFGPAVGAVEVDRSEPYEPVIAQIMHVGGTVLSLAEVRLDPPASSTTVLGEGDGWDLVAVDAEDGRWVDLRAVDLEGLFRLKTDGALDTLFASLGPCCRLGGDVFVIGALRSDATALRLTLRDGTPYQASPFTDPVTGVQYAIVLVPIDDLPADTTAQVEIDLADGTSSIQDFRIDLATIGG